MNTSFERLISAIENSEHIIVNRSYDDQCGYSTTFRIKNESSATGFTDVIIYDEEAEKAFFTV